MRGIEGLQIMFGINVRSIVRYYEAKRNSVANLIRVLVLYRPEQTMDWNRVH